jgi:hypothetical protein
MPVVCDFTVIQEGTRKIGDAGQFSKNFGTGGRHDTQALLMINVKNLTHNFAQVIINGTTLKALQPSSEADREQWFSQHKVLPSGLLSPVEGNNIIEIKRVLNNNPGNGGGQFDDFEIRDVVCFFHQAA